LTSIIEKRSSLHNELNAVTQENSRLKSRIEQLEMLANLGMATCMIAHEFSNLLTPLVNYAALAQKYPDEKALTEKALSKTVANSRRASEIMESLLAVANGQNHQKQDCDLNIMVENVFKCLCRDFSKDGITVKIEIPKGLQIRCVPVQLQQVIMNLVLNARDAMLLGGGTLTITAERSDRATCICVTDTGRGIRPEDLNKVFEPFYSTKEQSSQIAAGVCGLGLAFCRKIVEAHNGSISATSQPEGETTFRINLPGEGLGNS